MKPGTLSLDVIWGKLDASRDPVYGTDERDIVHWTTFGVRLVYNLAVAVIVEIGLEIGVWISSNLFDGQDASKIPRIFARGMLAIASLTSLRNIGE